MRVPLLRLRPPRGESRLATAPHARITPQPHHTAPASSVVTASGLGRSIGSGGGHKRRCLINSPERPPPAPQFSLGWTSSLYRVSSLSLSLLFGILFPVQSSYCFGAEIESLGGPIVLGSTKAVVVASVGLRNQSPGPRPLRSKRGASPPGCSSYGVGSVLLHRFPPQIFWLFWAMMALPPAAASCVGWLPAP